MNPLFFQEIWRSIWEILINLWNILGWILFNQKRETIAVDELIVIEWFFGESLGHNNAANWLFVQAKLIYNFNRGSHYNYILIER